MGLFQLYTLHKIGEVTCCFLPYIVVMLMLFGSFSQTLLPNISSKANEIVEKCRTADTMLWNFHLPRFHQLPHPILCLFNYLYTFVLTTQSIFEPLANSFPRVFFGCRNWITMLKFTPFTFPFSKVQFLVLMANTKYHSLFIICKLTTRNFFWVSKVY